MLRISPSNITNLKENEVFVFGSNLQGNHSGGAAYLAHEKFGAKMGVGIGEQGQCYAIPTLDYSENKYSASMAKHDYKIPLDLLKLYVNDFAKYASQNSNKNFLVTEIGCGIAGFRVDEIAPLFGPCLDIENVYLPKRFLDHLIA